MLLHGAIAQQVKAAGRLVRMQIWIKGSYKFTVRKTPQSNKPVDVNKGYYYLRFENLYPAGATPGEEWYLHNGGNYIKGALNDFVLTEQVPYSFSIQLYVAPSATNASI
ncbi:hypothetical protein RCN81_16440 [Escherichia coli]|nr:hypothetical protein [Escherichia coli]